MRLKSLLCSLLAAGAVVAAAAPDAEASHFRYGTLSWGPSAAARRGFSAAGEVRFDLRVALRRNATQYGNFPAGVDQFAETGDIITENVGGTRLIFGDGNATVDVLRFRVTDFSVTENWIIAVALNPGTNDAGIEHTYPGAGPYTARLGNSTVNDACCRLGFAELNNRADGSYPLQTIVRPLAGNRSPVSNLVPIVVVPESATATFLVPASDPDGDAVRWRLGTPAEVGTGGPIHPPLSLTVNPNTGVVTWNNVGQDRIRFWTTQIVIEDLDAQGNVKSKTPVDFLLKIVQQQGVRPSCAINPAGPFSVAPGTPIAFVLTGTDPDAGDQIILNASGMPVGATMTPALPTSGPTGVSSAFSWTPTAADEGTHIISFSATDTFGNQGLCNADITVVVNSGPSISCAADAKLECAGPGGTSHTMVTRVADQDGDSLTVTWTVDGVLRQTRVVPAPPSGPTQADLSFTALYTVGNHTVEVTVSDGQAAPTSCQTQVNVNDTSAPVVTCTTAETMLWPPNHNMVNVGLVATSTDTCTGNTGTAGVGVFGDEDDEDATGDGRHSPDASNIASGTLRLRSEREGDKDGRVYLILASATDGGGNTGHACCTVTVPHSMSNKDRTSVIAQAAAARAVCEATGAAPTGYYVVGDGPILGPKQLSGPPPIRTRTSRPAQRTRRQ